MARYADREHAIPLRKRELVRLLLRHLGSENPAEQIHFRELCRLIEAILHFEFHERLECFKELYAPFDPDAVAAYPVCGNGLSPASSASASIDTSQTSSQAPDISIGDSDAATLASCPSRKEFVAKSSIEAASLGKLLELVRYLLERGNFRRLDGAALEEAMRRPGRWRLNFEVNFDLFEILELYVRGDTIEKEKRPARLFGLISGEGNGGSSLRTTSLTCAFSWRCPSATFRGQELSLHQALQRRAQRRLGNVDSGHGNPHPPSGRFEDWYALAAGHTHLFVETGHGSGSYHRQRCGRHPGLAGNYGAPLSYGVRSYLGYVSTRQRYQLTVTQCLFFQNLDNNLGAITHLIDEAEKQEFREILLSWFFLWRFAGPQGWIAEALDDHIEEYLEREAHLRVDFEIEDALAKLVRYGLAEHDEQGRWRAVPLLTACERLDAHWDNFFRYNYTSLEPEPSVSGKSEN